MDGYIYLFICLNVQCTCRLLTILKLKLKCCYFVDVKPKVDENVAKIWTLSAQDDDLVS